MCRQPDVVSDVESHKGPTGTGTLPSLCRRHPFGATAGTPGSREDDETGLGQRHHRLRRDLKDDVVLSQV